MMGDGDDPSAFFAFHPVARRLGAAAGRRGATDATTSPALPTGSTRWRPTSPPAPRPTTTTPTAHPAAAPARAPERRAAPARPGRRGPVGDGLDRLLGRCTGGRPGRRRRARAAAARDLGVHQLPARRLVHGGRRVAAGEQAASATATGIQVGAYGWLEDVTAASGAPSQGYVLAPSTAHATTAAILRSGWSALRRRRRERRPRRRPLVGPHPPRALADRRRAPRPGPRPAARRPLRARACTTPGSTRWIERAAPAGARRGGRPGAAERRSSTGCCWPAGSPTWTATGRRARRLRPPDAKRAGDAARRRRAPTPRASTSVLDDAARRPRRGRRRGGRPERLLARRGQRARGDDDAVGVGHRRGRVPAAALRRHAARRRRRSPTACCCCSIPATRRAAGPARPRAGARSRRPALEAWLDGLLGDAGATTRFAVRFADAATGAPVAPAARAHAGRRRACRRSTSSTSRRRARSPGSAGSARVLDGVGRGPASRRPRPRGALVLATDVGDPSIDDLAVAARALRGLVGEARDLDGRDLAAPGATDAVERRSTRPSSRTASATCAGALETGRAGLAAALRRAGRQRARAHRRRARGDARAGRLRAPARRAARRAIRTRSSPRAQALLAAVDARLPRARRARGRGGPMAVGSTSSAATARCATASALLVGARSCRSRRAFTRPTAPARRELRAPPARARATAATEWLAAAGRVDPGARRLRVADRPDRGARDTSQLRLRARPAARLRRARAGPRCARPTHDERAPPVPARHRRAGRASPTARSPGSCSATLDRGRPAPQADRGARRALRLAVARGRRRRSCCCSRRAGDRLQLRRWCATCSYQTLDLAKIRARRAADAAASSGQFLPGHLPERRHPEPGALA